MRVGARVLGSCTLIPWDLTGSGNLGIIDRMGRSWGFAFNLREDFTMDIKEIVARNGYVVGVLVALEAAAVQDFMYGLLDDDVMEGFVVSALDEAIGAAPGSADREAALNEFVHYVGTDWLLPAFDGWLRGLFEILMDEGRSESHRRIIAEWLVLGKAVLDEYMRQNPEPPVADEPGQGAVITVRAQPNPRPITRGCLDGLAAA